MYERLHASPLRESRRLRLSTLIGSRPPPAVSRKVHGSGVKPVRTAQPFAPRQPKFVRDAFASTQTGRPRSERPHTRVLLVVPPVEAVPPEPGCTLRSS